MPRKKVSVSDAIQSADSVVASSIRGRRKNKSTVQAPVTKEGGDESVVFVSEQHPGTELAEQGKEPIKAFAESLKTFESPIAIETPSQNVQEDSIQEIHDQVQMQEQLIPQLPENQKQVERQSENGGEYSVHHPYASVTKALEEVILNHSQLQKKFDALLQNIPQTYAQAAPAMGEFETSATPKYVVPASNEIARIQTLPQESWTGLQAPPIQNTNIPVQTNPVERRSPYVQGKMPISWDHSAISDMQGRSIRAPSEPSSYVYGREKPTLSW